MKLTALVVGAVLTVGVAQAAGETRAVSPAQKVTSKDKGLTVVVPRGALKRQVKVRIRVLPRAQYPAELRNTPFSPGSVLYALEPAGTTFLKPVIVTRRVDARLQGFDLASVPGIVLTTRSSDGRWEILKELALRPAGTTLVISGTTRHFSTLVAFDGGARVSLAPNFIETRVGSTWDAAVSPGVESSIRRDRVVLQSVQWVPDGGVVAMQRAGGNGATFSCARAGNGSFRATAVLAENDLAVVVKSLRTQSYTQKFHLGGTAGCKAAPVIAVEPEPAVAIARAR